MGGRGKPQSRDWEVWGLSLPSLGLSSLAYKMGGMDSELKILPKNLASLQEGVADSNHLNVLTLRRSAGEVERVDFHGGASAHDRAAARSYSDAKLLHTTYFLTPFPSNSCSGFGPINASLWRLTLTVITCFFGQIIHSQCLPGFYHSCSFIKDSRASASNAPARVSA